MENRRRPTIEDLAREFPDIPITQPEGLPLPVGNNLGSETVIVSKSTLDQIVRIRMLDRLDELGRSNRPQTRISLEFYKKK